MKQVGIIVLLALFVAQWWIPAGMIAERENTLRKGKIVRFKTEPIDPIDVFRGKYVDLNFENTTLRVSSGQLWQRNEKVFAIVREHFDGYARIVNISRKRPVAGLYFETRIESVQRLGNQLQINLQIPFNRYYAGEFIAPDIERIYAEAGIEGWAQVRILNGLAVLEELYIQNKPVPEWFKERGSH
ncbi:MAG: GDYXXLXY domain-containing protein [Cyclobacteriaceae bacterium]|nr:GDYXXLXY domain-containing protein [Cyclobacteriaceae bacterium]